MSFKCLRCEDRGFIEAPLLMSAGNFGTLKQCCNIEKYSAEVARRLNQVMRSKCTDENKARKELGHVSQGGEVIPFRGKR